MIQEIAPHQLKNEYLPDAVPEAGDACVYVSGQDVGVRLMGDDAFDFPRIGEEGVPTEGLTYLFSIDETKFYLAPEEGQAEMQAPGVSMVHNRDIRMAGRGPRKYLYAAYTAVHLGGWYRANRYCGACGSKFSHHETLRALKCPDCGNTVFPRLNPAVIVCVCDPVRDKIVITRYARGRYVPIDALVAGFVEIGETIEDCVRREVREELGLEVTNIRYYKSQPWGVAGDILSGYWADVEGDREIHMDASELGRAVWLSPEEIKGQPDDLSLTNEMMCVWRDSHKDM